MAECAYFRSLTHVPKLGDIIHCSEAGVRCASVWLVIEGKVTIGSKRWVTCTVLRLGPRQPNSRFVTTCSIVPNSAWHLAKEPTDA